jgi:hypothetical protein
MSADEDDLKRRMEAAAADLDFEEASRLRDALSILQGGSTKPAEDSLSGWTHQEPGAMGLGTSDQKMTPPPGWTPPARPDPMTARHSRRGKRP